VSGRGKPRRPGGTLEREDRALVLRRARFAESSQTALLLTRAEGPVSVLARGILRPQGELREPLDLLHCYRVRWRPRSEGAQALLVRSRVIDGFRGLRRARPRLEAGLHLIELLRLSATPGVGDPRLFDETVGTLQALSAAPAESVAPLRQAWRAAFLRHLGCQPVLDRCVFCGQGAPPAKDGAFSLAQGGLICRACRERRRTVTRVLPAACRALLLALQGVPSPAEGGALRAPPEVEARVEHFQLVFLQRVLEHEVLTARSLGAVVDPRRGSTYDPRR
jgi:DNA repair protein RecO (recombination protein O)